MNGKQILEYNQRNNPIVKLVLQVKITNKPTDATNGEDAHQARLNVTLPDTLTYSNVRSVRTLPQIVLSVGGELG